MTRHASCALTVACCQALAFVICTGLAFAQSTDPGKKGTLERIKVHGKALEGNLEGDSPDRDVSIYLPPGYASNRTRRYPVMYLLHGYTDSDDRWFGLKQSFVNVPVAADKAIAAGAARDLIIVMPNAYTAYQGSMYSNSATTGDWEAFVARDLVSYIDAHYRTIPDRTSRGLAGHSMGGYGTIRIGMKHPEVFSSLYVLSACCMPANMSPSAQTMARAEAVKTADDLAKADFGTKAMIASAAAWSPNPKNPPFFFDLPMKDGQVQSEVVAKWAANAPLTMVHQYIPNLKAMRDIAMDAGDMDTGIAAATKMLDQILTQYDVRHTFEIYEGNHTNRIADRIEKQVLPFFTKSLSFTPAKP